MRQKVSLGATALAIIFASGTALADDVYSGFPVTVKGYDGNKTTSVAYTGQIARHVLHDSLKKLANSGNGSPNQDLKAKMMAYFQGKYPGRAIIAPKTKGPVAVKQSGVDDISKKKNLAGKTYKGTISGMPNNMTGPELVTFWIDKASAAKKGYDAANGYDYGQLISKFIMGAVSYNQAVDNYLDEKLSADKKPNDKPYKKGAYYTGKEHSWDEGFGYFGAPAHTMTLTPRQVYEIAKQGKKSKDPKDALMAADHNKDGKVDIAVSNSNGVVRTLIQWQGWDFENGGTYNAFATPQPEKNTIRDIHVHDVDGDGIQDLVLAGESTGYVSIVYGTGNFVRGHFFARSEQYFLGQKTRSIAIGDFNGDKKSDLAVLRFSTDDVIVLEGTQ